MRKQIALSGLKPTSNLLEVDVTRVAANRIRDMDRRHVVWRIFKEINFVNIDHKPFAVAGARLRPARTGPPDPDPTVHPMTSEENAAVEVSAARGIDLLRRGIAIAFLVTLLLSRKLWLTARDYPLTPIWTGEPQAPYPLDHIVFWVMAASLAAVAVLRNPRIPLRLVVAIGVLWAVLDQSRWQPYFIHYMVILACMLALPFERRKEWVTADVDWALLPARMTLAVTYFYSGIQKLNYQFTTDVFPWMVTPLKRMIHLDLSHWGGRWEAGMALGAAGAEAIFGILLLHPRTRRPAALFLICMHGFILLMIGPFGYKWNAVIWPWNCAMMLALWSLFARKSMNSWSAPGVLTQGWWREVLSRRSFMVPGVLVAFGIMPLFNFIDRWDSYPSFSLYSGSTCKSEIEIDPADWKWMPAAAKSAIDPDTGDVDLISWSTSELGAMPYPEHRIAMNAAISLAKRARNGPVLIQLQSRPNPLTGVRKYRYYRLAPGTGRPSEISESVYNAEH